MCCGGGGGGRGGGEGGRGSDAECGKRNVWVSREHWARQREQARGSTEGGRGIEQGCVTAVRNGCITAAPHLLPQHHLLSARNEHLAHVVLVVPADEAEEGSATLPSEEAPLHAKKRLAQPHAAHAHLAHRAAPQRVVAVEAVDLALWRGAACELAAQHARDHAAASGRVRCVRHAVQKGGVVLPQTAHRRLHRRLVHQSQPVDGAQLRREGRVLGFRHAHGSHDGRGGCGG